MKHIIFIALIFFLALPCAGQEGRWFKVIGEDLTVGTYGGRIIEFWCPNDIQTPDSVWVPANDSLSQHWEKEFNDSVQQREMTSREKFNLLLDMVFSLQAEQQFLEAKIQILEQQMEMVKAWR